MSLINVLRTGISGMNAQSNRISTVAENIQNSGTTGYKRASAEFESLLINSGETGNYNSGAVETKIRHAVSEQGTPTYTTSKTDLAIQGNGFFVVKDTNGAAVLTRAGNFVLDDATGSLVNAGGFTLMGYATDAKGNPTSSPTLNGTDGMVPVSTAGLGLKAIPSTAGSLGGNLPDDLSAAPVKTGALAADNYSKKYSLNTYDNVGKQVTLDVYMQRTGDKTWSVSVFDAAAPASFPATPLTAPTTLTFDGSGKVTGAPASTFTIPNGQSFKLDMSGVTQLAADYDVTGKADGKAPVAVTGAEFSTDGTVYAIYADASRVAAFKVPLADVRSPDNLDLRSGNVFLPNQNSGDIQIGFAGVGGRGSIKAGALEQSNVDVSTELTSMIESQSVYTANSKVFMTGNELLDTLMNLKR